MKTSKCIAYWIEPTSGAAQVVFDPWGARDQAINTHSGMHTEWAENIHENHKRGNLLEPAVFPEWKGKTVVLAGRGPSLKESARYLEEAQVPTVFLNHAYLDAEVWPDSWVATIDSCFKTVRTDAEKVKGLGLISMPGISTEIVEDYPWRERRGFTFWNVAPLNDWMRRMYPGHPELIECASVSVSALHLMALSGVRRVVCVGWDFCGSGDDARTPDINGDIVTTSFHHLRASQAATFFARILGQHSEMEIINASGRGLFGLNVSARPQVLVEEVKQATPEELPKMLKE